VPQADMEERIRLIDHQGKRVLLVDFSNCSANEVEELARAVPDHVTVNPRGSVLVLTDFTGAAFDRDALRAMKEATVFDKPFVRKSALLGTEDPFKRIFPGCPQSLAQSCLVVWREKGNNRTSRF
jgi:hypothetical protein